MDNLDISTIDGLRILKVKDKVLLAHQIKPPYYFSCCDGLILLPTNEGNQKTVILDLNIEPYLINQINDLYGPISDYICTHGHMDHIAHVHQWESIGAKIHAPIPDDTCLLDLHNFYEGFQFDEALDFSIIEKFGELNGYNTCKEIYPFKPGKSFLFDELEIKTIPFLGHSKAHIGFLLVQEKIIHISCLGFDQVKPGVDGFGPWYGFKECSIDQYLKDIDLAQSIFLEQAEFLTSSHSYIIENPDITPFLYMREKIEKNQNIIDQAILTLKLENKSKISLEVFLDMDLFFPKKKMDKFRNEIYKYWESGIIHKHIERSKYLK
ncbi:MAG: MBL fold metallo-hydrolase [Candidatus Lokiarchaeota archaeon]|nr:MBL fold metallo-hydrolase [Candidatus Lokiarchaeota archaeon]